MNRGKLLLQSLIVAAVLALASCTPATGPGLGGGIPGSKTIKTETRHPGAFEAIVLEYPADVTLQQGADNTVRIQADDNLLPQISTEVVSGTLTIDTTESAWKARVNPSEQVKITVTVNKPTEIVFAAPVGTLQANGVKAGTLKLVLSGAGQINVTGIQADYLEAVLSGAGDVQVAGAADELRLTLSGWGNFDAAGLTSSKATIELSGAGDVNVHAEKELVATVKGAGSVTYYGQPHVQQTISGSGSVQPAGQND